MKGDPILITLSKKVLLPVAAIAVIGAGALGVATVSAASSPIKLVGSEKLPTPSILIRPRYRPCFDQTADRQAQAETTYEDRLNQAVTDGKLTPTEIRVLAEHNQLKSELDTAMQKKNRRRPPHMALDQVRTEAKLGPRLTTSTAKWLPRWAPAARHGTRWDADHNATGDAVSPSPTAAPSVRQQSGPFARRHLPLAPAYNALPKVCP